MGMFFIYLTSNCFQMTAQQFPTKQTHTHEIFPPSPSLQPQYKIEIENERFRLR